tara:strand:+ start:76283 stop:77038 length:756 start_codon:yes stop_codon:yes gene_type:complete
MHSKTLFLLVFVAAVCGCEQNVQRGETLPYKLFLENHIAASGGKDAIESLKNVNIRLNIKEGENLMDAHYRANRDGQMRIDIYIGDARVFTEALSSANDGWQQDGEGANVKPLSDEGMGALQRGVHFNLYGLHELSSLGYTLDYQGMTDFRGVEHYTIDITSATGKFERRFYDPVTYLQAASMDESALHVDVDATKTRNATLHSDYREVSGVMMSFAETTIDLDQDKIIQQAWLKQAEINIDHDRDQFLRP